MNDMIILQVYGVIIFTVIGYLLSRILKRNDIADTLWGLGFIAVALIHATQITELSFRAKLMLTFVLVWGLRLAIHIGFRTFKHKHEDIRYANWRQEWKQHEPLMAFLKVFLLQGVVLGFVSVPIAITIESPGTELTPYDFLGGCLFLIGFIFESIADAELMVFKSDSNNKGKVLKSGLWSLSRHPNYFGEILTWWGLFFMTLSLHHGWVALFSPLLITYLLTKVSGVPMLENVMKTKGADFENYVKNTPALLPFRFQAVKTFLLLAIVLVILDFLWLGILMNKFYFNETLPVARILNGSWDVLYWPAVGVYFFIALGIKLLAIDNAASRLQAIFKAFILGLVIYTVYDFTNLALVNRWPLQMSLIDIIWGGLLCAISAALAFKEKLCDT